VNKSNCLLWAVPRWIARGRPEQERYLVIRWSRIPWGFLHFLVGEMDPATGQIQVTSYKPPPGHRKTRPAFTFAGSVTEGDH